MIFYDFEVFEKDWLAVFIDVTKKKEHVIINSPDKLKALYEANRKDIWVGFNNRHYDQYIMKGILLGMNPKKINDWIIVDNKEGWQYSRAFNKLPMINYDVMPSNDETMKTVGLKTMEGFLGSNIKETDVDFRIKRKLTQEEIEQTVKYCRHDVEQTIKVFLEKVSEFNAVHGIIQAFPKETSLYDIGDSEARITAKVLGCSKTHFGDEFDFFFLPCLKLKKYKYVQEWFAEKRKEALEMGLQDFDKKDKKTWYKSQNFETIVAGIPHTFGFGGLHGASDKPIHRKGQILHVDVNNYYMQLQPEVQQALEMVQVGQRKQPLMRVVLLKSTRLTVRLLYVGEVKKTFGATFGNLSMVSIFGAMEKWAVVSLIFVLISVLQNQRTVETMNLPDSQ